MSVPVSTAVTRVVDYEPPMLGARPQIAPPRRPGARTTQPRMLHAVPPVSAPPDQLRAAGAFADAALRRVLEVIDRRRPVSQLRPLLAGGLTDAVLALHRLVPASEGTAVLRRIRMQAAAHDGSAVEVSATYTRGDRVHAIACRVEQLTGPTGLRWQIVALHIG